LQEELATEISEKLRLQLTGEDKKRLRKRPTQNNEAFRLVLQAQHYISGLSPEGLRKGIALCQQAIAIDPGYAAAYARMGLGYSSQLVFGYEDLTEVSSQLKVAAKKALELDDSLAEAHVASSCSLFFLNWDHAGAEREARRGIELNPDSTEAWALLDECLLSEGRFDEAIAAGRRAVEIAPLDYYSAFVLGVTYFHAQRFEESIALLRKAVDIDAGSPAAHASLAHSYAAAGQQQNAVEECGLALALNRKDRAVVVQVAAAYAMAGEAGEARKLADEAAKNWKPDGITAFWLASVYSSLGDNEKAFEWMEKAYQEHSAMLTYVKIMWTHSRLHGDPRFDALVKRIGIPD
jgi:tetratricopeptide (TPR) repeat protein